MDDGIPARRRPAPEPRRAVLARSPALACVALLLAACGGADDYQSFQGATMGTQYRITAQCPVAAAAIAEEIEAELVGVNGEMSTYDPQSALSRFNAAPAETWVEVPAALVTVVEAALHLSERSTGAFDVTVGPLVNVWGFGPDGPIQAPPAPEALEAARERVGYHALEVRREPPALRKRKALYVDLSAIAKGHGVDRVAERLRGLRCSDFLVDIGGEVRVQGRSPRGGAWRVGVEVPDPGRYGAVERVLTLTDRALATSGDYRNFVELEGERFSHTIDPRLGAPVHHRLASATVIHASAMWADGYATTLMVLGPDEALAFAEREGLAVYLLVRSAEGLESRYTRAMTEYLDTLE